MCFVCLVLVFGCMCLVTCVWLDVFGLHVFGWMCLVACVWFGCVWSHVFGCMCLVACVWLYVFGCMCLYHLTGQYGSLLLKVKLHIAGLSYQ